MKRLLFFSLFTVLAISPVIAATVNLAWTAPTINSDGTPLSDLAGYGVCLSGLPIPDNRGIADCNHNVVADTSAPGPNTVVQTIIDCDVSPCYFRVYAYDDKSPPNEGKLSNQASDTIIPQPDTISPDSPMDLKTIGVK